MSDRPSPEQAAGQTPVTPPPFPNARPSTPVPPPMPAAPATPAAPAKKKRGCLIASLISLVLLLAAVGTLLAVVSAAGKPRDLGVRYSIADYHRASKKVGLAEFAIAKDDGPGEPAPTAAASKTPKKPSSKKTSPASGSKKKTASTPDGTADDDAAAPAATAGDKTDGSGFTTDVIYTGDQPFDAVLTSAEMSALLNYSHMPGWPISQAQVLFVGDNGFMMSCLIEYAGMKYPVFAQGTVGVAGGAISGMATSAQVLGFDVPAEYLGPGSDYVVGLINSRLARLGTLNIEEATIVDGGVHLVGTAPDSARPR